MKPRMMIQIGNPLKVGASTDGDLVNDSYLMHFEEDVENVIENILQRFS